MPVTGIIAEYNPFHNGHLYQLQELRRLQPGSDIIAVMSGSFTQRGSAAILDKWKRAELAVRGGCDLVLELPAVFALRSAQDFAQGGISLLSKLSIVDFIAFGTESLSCEQLGIVSKAVASDEFQKVLRQNLKLGRSYAASICTALSQCVGLPESLLREPNNILAMEYLRALQTTGNPLIQPVAIPRKNAGHHDSLLHAGISSATAIRQAVSGDAPDWELLSATVPTETFSELREARGNGLPSMERLFRALLTKLYTSDLEMIRNIYGIGEGMENRLLRSSQTASCWEDFVTRSASRRYPMSRIRRVLLYLLFGWTRQQITTMDLMGPSYVRVLAFNDNGRKLLKRIRQESGLPVITKLTQHLSSRSMQDIPELPTYQQQLSMDITASALRSLTLSKLPPGKMEFNFSPYYHNRKLL